MWNALRRLAAVQIWLLGVWSNLFFSIRRVTCFNSPAVYIAPTNCTAADVTTGRWWGGHLDVAYVQEVAEHDWRWTFKAVLWCGLQRERPDMSLWWSSSTTELLNMFGSFIFVTATVVTVDVSSISFLNQWNGSWNVLVLSSIGRGNQLLKWLKQSAS